MAFHFSKRGSLPLPHKGLVAVMPYAITTTAVAIAAAIVLLQPRVMHAPAWRADHHTASLDYRLAFPLRRATTPTTAFGR
jgi:hypothetical protein